MNSRINTGDSYIVEGKLALPYTYFAGRVGSRFLTTLRDEKKILGIRCHKCGITFIPPRQVCDICMEKIDNNWVELKDTGKILSSVVVRYADRHLPRKPPYVLALILLDGADTPFVHIVSGTEPENVQEGMRVRAVFAKDPEPTILAIDHFAPA